MRSLSLEQWNGHDYGKSRRLARALVSGFDTLHARHSLQISSFTSLRKNLKIQVGATWGEMLPKKRRQKPLTPISDSPLFEVIRHYLQVFTAFIQIRVKIGSGSHFTTITNHDCTFTQTCFWRYLNLRISEKHPGSLNVEAFIKQRRFSLGKKTSPLLAACLFG
jgi:hypothetical protein